VLNSPKSVMSESVWSGPIMENQIHWYSDPPELCYYVKKKETTNINFVWL
jgi:hypothetical protein